MAVDFNGTTGYYQRTGAILTAVPITMSCLFNSDTVAANQTLMAIGDTNNAAGFVLGLNNTGDVVRARVENAGAGNEAVSASSFTAGTWFHGCAVFTSATSRQAGINGVLGTAQTTSRTPASVDHDTIGVWDRNSVLTNFMDGRIAEAAIWNVVLDAAELLALSGGWSPLLIRRSALRMYCPLITNVGVERLGLVFTPTGTTATADHPRMFYPGTPRLGIPSAAAAATVAPGFMGMGNQFVAWHAGTIDPTMHKISDGISA